MRIGGRFMPGGIALFVLFAVTYLLTAFGPAPLQNFIVSYLVLQPNQALGFKPYQLVIGPTLMTNFISLLFLGLLLWSVSSAIEQRVGTRKFLLWSAGASGAAAILGAGFGRLLGLVWPQYAGMPLLFDAQPVFMSTLVAFAHYYGNMPVTMWGVGNPVSGRGLSWFFVCLGFAADILRQQWLLLAAEIGAVLFMMFVLGGASGIGTTLRGGWKWFRGLFGKRRRLGVMDGGLGRGQFGGMSSPSSKPKERWIN